MPQNIEQGEPLATQFFLLEDIEPSEPFATEAHFPLLEDIEPSEPFATEAYFPLLEDIEASEPFATETHFPLLEDIEPSELFAREAHFPLETELFDLMDEFFNTISSCPKKNVYLFTSKKNQKRSATLQNNNKTS